jgi:hypothetical protein
MQTNKRRGRPPSDTSRRAIAKNFGISERLLYYTLQLQRSGRTDLIEAVRRGEMSHAAACQKLTGKRTPDHYRELWRAWSRCEDQEREQFLLRLAELRLITLQPIEP